MKKNVEQLKQEQTEQWIGEIHELKERVDENYRRETELRAEIDEFTTQYETSIRALDRQRRELENQVQRYRYRIEHFYDEEPDALPDGVEDTESLDETPTAGEELEEPSLPTDLGKALEEEKQRIRNYFARCWHPDRSRERAYPKEGLMAQVNVAFDNSQDAAEMLTVIPWREVWVERQKDETIGAQWERLFEWKAHLSTADERLTRRLQRLTQDWRYPLCQEWKAAPNKRDYFDALVDHERKEIRRLEGTLAILQEKLKQMEQQAQGAEAD